MYVVVFVVVVVFVACLLKEGLLAVLISIHLVLFEAPAEQPVFAK